MLRDDGGFTLMETLFVLCMVVMFTLLMPTMVKIVQQSFGDNTNSKLVMTIFFNQLASEVSESTSVVANEGHVVMTKGDGTEIRYSYVAGDQIRRYTNNSGYVPILYQVKRFTCDKENVLVTCAVLLLDGTEGSFRMMPMYGVGSNEQ
ncbi:competence type IV pilus minor pilin ComGF [Bacillus sp. FJAT-45037]|uniref:competence type IV pilus minor pilin ComGF n=1 Tax=Bacillus sp. FJAT-45037 TaxID=2011007 RepID=UPI0012FD4F49|nr:competence type IV pilus minor pilin ComGF [Bacillus sp. FJAT-45037]